MVEVENHFTVFIRLPFNRGDFVDPPPVSWSAAKERTLWDVISRQAQGKGNEIDWHALAEQFEVTQPFILQQAAWLYERQLSQVRAQLRKVGNRSSNTASPAPGSVASSMMGGQAMKRAGSGGSRIPSRLSTQHLGSPVVGGESSTPPTPARSKTSLPLRNVSGGQPAPPRPSSGSSRPLSRQPSKEADPSQYSHSRRGSAQHQFSRSPKAVHIDASDSDDDTSQSKLSTRRANPSSLHRRSLSLRKEQPVQPPKPPADEGDDDDDSPNFLPFASDTAEKGLPRPVNTSNQDPGATLRGNLNPTSPQRPSAHRRSTSEKITSPTKMTSENPILRPSQPLHLSSSTSSLSSSNIRPTPTAGFSRSNRTANPSALSPRQQAALASAGLSPRRRAHGNGGSESSPSMGSSFSDLDDASVTQSALEEALMSGMGNTTTTLTGGMANRVSGISQALRSRYFETRAAQPPGHQRENER